MDYTLDAKGIALGRTASKAAQILQGKDAPGSHKNQVSPRKVVIINASLASISQKKKDETDFARYSGYPGGLRFESMEKIITKKGYRELFRQAIYGMLPPNKLRAKIMKNITITE